MSRRARRIPGLAGRLGNLDVVDYSQSAGGLGHARRRAFMLHNAGRARPGCYAFLHMHLKPILADLRFQKLRLNGGLDLRVAELSLAMGRSEFPGGSGPRAGCQDEQREDCEKGSHAE